MRTYPIPPYPNGWFRVAFSDEVPVGAVKAAKYFGRELVIFRGEDGQVRVMDAFCPHMGAHLGKGGKVVDNTLKCPYHGWRFDGCGTCVEIPFATKIPGTARVQPWPIVERNGIVFAHYDAEGRPPDFDIPTIPEYSSGEYAHGRTGTTIRAHIQETQENMIDTGHFNFIHNGFRECPRITQWEEDGRHFRVQLSALSEYGPFVSPCPFTFDVYGIGLQVVHIEAKMRFVIVFAITPIDEESIDFRFMVLYKKTRFRILSSIMQRVLLKRVMTEIGEDIPVWENKIFPERPVLAENDRDLIRFRKWNHQFYTFPNPQAVHAAGVRSETR
jgi:phenylpropionate dioxygenase-like ring-hydroxylating dioxygenase large terminal subunit